MHRTRLIALLVTIMTAVGSPVFADGVSPWLPAPGAGFFNLSYVSQNATEFYRQEQKVQTPGPMPGQNLGQHTVWLSGMYGLSDEIAIDFRVGAARSYFGSRTGMGDPIPPTGGRDKYSGVADSNIGVTWRIVDELVKPSLPSIALRGGAIIAGSYTPGYINSIGDGASGFEVSALAGKYFMDRFAVSGEVGYRDREGDVPADFFLNVSGGVLVDNIGLSVNYKLVDAQSGLQIGVSPFTPIGGVFPLLEEDVHFLSGTVTLNVTDTMNLGLSYGEVIDGRNTSKSKVFSATMSYMFDTAS